MFRKHPEAFSDLLHAFMRENGLETPILQRRVLSAWDDIAGPVVARYTTQKSIKNQTLLVKISSPSLRSNLSMARADLVKKLNAAVGSYVISDIRFY